MCLTLTVWWSTLLLCTSAAWALEGQAGQLNFTKPELDDLVVVFGTNAQDDHVSLALATRLWRKVDAI